MDDIIISVVIPLYNSERYILNMLGNILKQTYTNFEVLVVNDGSTDRSGELVSMLKDSRIRLINQENAGAPNARNVGIENAKGKYLIFLDADDEIENNMFARLIEGGENGVFDLVICGYYMELKDKQENVVQMKQYMIPACKCYTKDQYLDVHIKLWNASLMYNVWNKLYKTSIIKENEIRFKTFESRMGEDIYFNEDYLRAISTICVIEDCCYHYVREREASITTSYVKGLFGFRKQEYIDMIDFFMELGDVSADAKEFCARRFIERVMGCISNEFKVSTDNKIQYLNVKKIVKDETVQQALPIMKATSKKMWFMTKILCSRNVLATFFLGKIIGFMNLHFPRLFFMLKVRR